jgi:hypothetical protein
LERARKWWFWALAIVFFYPDLTGLADKLSGISQCEKKNSPTNEGSKMKYLFFINGSKINGQILLVAFVDSDHVRATIVASNASFFTNTPKGNYLYKGRIGDWWTGNVKSSNQPTMVKSPANEVDYATLSADGKAIVWVVRKENVNALIVTDSKGEQQKTIKEELGFIRVPAWSPQSTRIAYYYGKSNVLVTDEFILKVVSADGRDGKELTPPSQPTGISADRTQAPRWSPDGNRILFVGNYEPNMLVREYAYLVDVDKAGFRVVEGGTWNKDGTTLLLVRRKSQPYGPFVLSSMDPSTCVAKDVDLGMELPASVPNGQWSPDAKWYAFTTNENQLYLIDIVRKKKTKLLDYPEGGIVSWIDPD